MHTYPFCKNVPRIIRQRNSGLSHFSASRKRTFASIFTAAVVMSAAGAAAQVPSVVVTNTIPLAKGFSAGPAVTDACGNVYVYEGGGTGIVQINAATGVVTVVAPNAQGYTSSGQALAIDFNKKNIYYPDFSNFYTTHFVQQPINNCTPGAPSATFGSNLGNLGNYYYGTVMDAAGDAAGNVYFTTTSNVQKAIYKETFVAGTSTYTDTQILTWKNNINHIAADAAGDVFFVDQSTADVYELPLTGATYPATPILLVNASNFGSVSGLSFDPQGNLYITDSKKNLIFEVPNEAGTLNASDLYATASIGVPFKVAVDASHTIYLSNYGPGAAKLTHGSALFAATAVGATSPASSLTYVFNSAVTPTAITTYAGTAATTRFATATGGTCAVGTAQAALSTCMINATFTPSAVGNQTGALVFSYATGSLISNLAGVGNGAAATIDPGTVVSSTTVLAAPSGVTVDNLGNVFVTDTSANTLTEFAAGFSGVGTAISTGTLKLKGPKAVAVDASGDIFIADTGNSRIVEIPVTAGVLTNASAFALPLTTKNPQGVAVDSAGNLYVADTGNNNILVTPNIGGTLNFPLTQSYGTGLNAPTALTFDQNGNLFVVETGGNDVLQFTAPIGSAQVKVASGFSGPTGVATDASNSLYVVDGGSGSIARFPNVNGVFGAKSLVGGTVVNPVGVAADSNGNLYVTDTVNSLTAEVTRVTASMQFGGVNVGSVGTQSSFINSSGNLPLTFPKPDYVIKPNPATGFNVTGDSCAGATFNPGTACTITATYTPSAPQLNAEEDLQFSANSSNGMPLLQLIGTGARITPSTVTLVLTTPVGATSLNAGQAVTFTATIGVGTNPAVPGGSVKFFVNGSQVGTVAVKNGIAVLSLPNGLPAGSPVLVTATYTGDVINYSGSTGTLNETVVALADTVNLTITTPYNNPLSANDNAANAAGPSIPLVATITPSSTIAPGGTVTFYAGSTVLGVVSVVPGSGGFTATLATTALRAGTTTTYENGSYVSTYAISAVYSGDATYVGGATPSQSVTIVGANTTANPLNTTGSTFTISPTNPTITVQSTAAGAQASGSTVLTITSYGGWAGVLNFTCSGLPAYSTCNQFPGAPIVNASKPSATVPPTQVNFIITTNVPPVVPTASAIVWWGGGLAGLLLLAMRRRMVKLGHLRAGGLLSMAGVLALMLASVFGITACSTSSSSVFATPAGTSNVTVTVRAAQFVANSATNVQVQDVQVAPINIKLVVQ